MALKRGRGTSYVNNIKVNTNVYGLVSPRHKIYRYDVNIVAISRSNRMISMVKKTGGE